MKAMQESAPQELGLDVGNPVQIGNIRIWLKDLDDREVSVSETEWLSEDERDRATRLKDPEQRRRFFASRVISRTILADELGVKPSAIQILVDRCGKSRLAILTGHSSHSANGISFNISHSENILCIAIGIDCEIGVDIEVVNHDIDALDVGKASLGSESIKVLEGCPSKRRVQVFFRLWTEREAFAKMLGHRPDSDHLQLSSAGSWRKESLEFNFGNKRVVGCLIVSLPTQNQTGRHSERKGGIDLVEARPDIQT